MSERTSERGRDVCSVAYLLPGVGLGNVHNVLRFGLRYRRNGLVLAKDYIDAIVSR